MKSWPSLALGEIFEIARGGSPRPIQDFITDDPDGVNWIMIGDASEGSKYITSTKKRILKNGIKKSRMVYPGDFLLTNSMSFGHPYILKTSGCIHDGWLVLSKKIDGVDPNYFYYLLGSNFVYLEFSRRASGTTVKNLNIDLVKGVNVPLPPLEEQRRIAAILDKADEVRRKRQEAIRLTEELLRSLFLDMFGDPVTNPKGWESVNLSEIIQGDMRNGLSPSNRGTYQGTVLTLSAITQGNFDQQARKEACFDISPPEEKMVRKSVFLVCRGNGNISLVGCGRFPDKDYESIMFPDTMIAVPIDFSKVRRYFFEYLWNSPFVRQQIEKQARTTNGTYKINQKVLQGIEILLPPNDLQDKFTFVYSKTQLLKKNYCMDRLNDFFNSLLQRAFRGEL